MVAESLSRKQPLSGLDTVTRTAIIKAIRAIKAVAAVAGLERVAADVGVSVVAFYEDSEANHAAAPMSAQRHVAKHQLPVIPDVLILVVVDVDAVESFVVGSVDPVVADADATWVALVTPRIVVADATRVGDASLVIAEKWETGVHAVPAAAAAASFVVCSAAVRANVAVTEPTSVNPLAMSTELAECKAAFLEVAAV